MQLNTRTAGNLDFGRELKVLALTQGIAALTGEQPIVNEYPEYTQIDFTDNQRAKLTNQLAQWHDKEPGPVRVNVSPVLTPFYIKKYGIFVLGAAAAGFLIGFLMKR